MSWRYIRERYAKVVRMAYTWYKRTAVAQPLSLCFGWGNKISTRRNKEPRSGIPQLTCGLKPNIVESLILMLSSPSIFLFVVSHRIFIRWELEIGRPVESNGRSSLPFPSSPPAPSNRGFIYIYTFFRSLQGEEHPQKHRFQNLGENLWQLYGK